MSKRPEKKSKPRTERKEVVEPTGNEEEGDGGNTSPKIEMELPPSGSVPKMRSELSIPTAVATEAQDVKNRIRPSTTEKLRSRTKETINNPKPEIKNERATSNSLPVIKSDNLVVRKPSNFEEISEEEDEEQVEKMKKKRPDRPGSDVLRMILERKAQKIQRKRSQRTPMSTRMKTFFDRIKEISPPEPNRKNSRSFLPPI